jgi:flavin reductase (DIM6/NTAB) family NADH-FMN oxidoreductase RutF
VIIDPLTLDRRERSGLINGIVMPRPIAWVSTIAPDGSRNLAPFSFFGGFSFDPPTIGLGPGSRAGVHKDSLRNIKATGEFVVNLVNRRLAEQANACGAEFGADVDEWDIAGVEAAPSEVVAPMRIREAPASLECRVRQIIELGDHDHPSNNLVVAWVVRVHVADEALDGLTPLPDVLDLVGRLGGDEWCTTRERFTLPRPSSTDPAVVKEELHARLEAMKELA